MALINLSLAIHHIHPPLLPPSSYAHCHLASHLSCSNAVEARSPFNDCIRRVDFAVRQKPANRLRDNPKSYSGSKGWKNKQGFCFQFKVTKRQRNGYIYIYIYRLQKQFSSLKFTPIYSSRLKLVKIKLVLVLLTSNMIWLEHWVALMPAGCIASLVSAKTKRPTKEH